MGDDPVYLYGERQESFDPAVYGSGERIGISTLIGLRKEPFAISRIILSRLFHKKSNFQARLASERPGCSFGSGRDGSAAGQRPANCLPAHRPTTIPPKNRRRGCGRAWEPLSLSFYGMGVIIL